MGRLKRSIDNKGVSLLLVIVAMSFVAVIAAVVVAITYRNLETMRNNLGSTKNFYTAETAMDEMRMKFYEWSDEAFRNSYEKWIQQYNSVAEDGREKLFKTEYVKELEKVINDKFMCYFGESPKEIDELFVNFTSDRVSWNEGFVPYIEKNDDETVMTVRDISLVYKDSSDYETTITTDLKLDVKYDGLAHNTLEDSDADCAAYAIISDCRIGNIANSDVRIEGNIYAGGYNSDKGAYGDAGILFNGGKLDIYADKIVSRGDIEFTNEAQLNAKGAESGDGSNGRCNIWAKGFDLTGVGAAVVDILGSCYVYDDTTIDAAKSSFTVDGAYYGYNTNNAASHIKDADDVELRMGTPEGSSSIVINGNETKVDLTKCDPVWIAGKTFVSVPKLYGEADILDTNVPFPEGEAISYRGTQSAYLMPGDCIIGIGHNPMSQEEYEKLISEDDETVFIDLDKSRKNGGVALAGYVQIDRPYRVATVDYSSSDPTNKLVYLYLNFISTDKATEYFQEYSEKYNELLESKMAMLGGGSILFDPETLVTTGNVLSYKEKSGKPDVSVTGGKYTVFDENIEDKEAELNNSYHGLITALDENYAGVGASEFMTDNFVNFDKVNGSVDKEEWDLDHELDSGKKYKLITGNNINITGNVNAIILSTGDVTIAAGAIVHGLILARGNITLAGATVYAEPDDVSELILNDERVAPYFSFDTTNKIGSQGNGMFSSDLIAIDYMNWRKN